MQNLLSVREFKIMCDTLSPHKFIFTSENQQWDRVNHTAKVNLSFRIMLIAFNPNTIFFKNEYNWLCLERVKYIKVNRENPLIGVVFTVVCGSLPSTANDISYTILAC